MAVSVVVSPREFPVAEPVSQVVVEPSKVPAASIVDEQCQREGSGATWPNKSARWQDDFLQLTNEFELDGVQSLRGNTINVPFFEQKLPAAVEAGLVTKVDADYILHGLKRGFDLHLDESMMPGKKVYRNYKSAYENKPKVHSALAKRVKDGKTLKLGAFNGRADDLPGDQGCVVPNGAVPKRLEPDAARPFSDHTKTKFNAACKADWLKHSLNTYQEIADELKPDYFMRVEDIDGAYPVLPLAPRVWKYMYVWWFDVDRPLEDQVRPNTLYVHVFGDFGTSPMPGVWDKFFRCVKAMAQLDGVLKSPMPHYVDDNSLIGPDADLLDEEARELGLYLIKCGLKFKTLKSRHAAMVQLVLGFWWDSHNRTRALEKEKLHEYLECFRAFSLQRSASLHDLQVVIGRMHRATLTMPPGSTVFLARLIALTRGLTQPWQRKRITAGARDDVLAIVSVLTSNHGKGYFDTTHLPWAPDVYTDAMKDSRTAAWGWCSTCGTYDFGVFGSAKKRKHIDELEGFAVLQLAKSIGKNWFGKRVRVWIDNSAFCYSLAKGRSKVERLTNIIRQLYQLSAEYNCILVPSWIATEENIGADALSRNDESLGKEWLASISPASVSIRRWCNP